MTPTLTPQRRATLQRRIRWIVAATIGYNLIEAVTAIVVTKDGYSPTASDLLAHVKGRIADFKIPKKILFVDSLPRNSAGKLLKRELRTHFSNE